MDGSEKQEVAGPRGAASGVFIALLVASASLYQGYNAWLALDPDDTNHLETPLILATARQLADGPSTLYGPFSGDHPLVLIHAPLYYRAVAVLAWPLAVMGIDPTIAAMAAGRFLSALSLLATMAAVSWIARGNGAGPASGWMAALLLAGCPVLGSFGFTVRPDMLAVALQTWGFGLSMKALREGTLTRPITLIASGILFGLAACAKQHLLVAGGVAVLFLGVASARGRISKTWTLAALVTGLVVLGSYYSWEEWVTGGMMSRSVFVLPSLLRKSAPGSWQHVFDVFFEVSKLAVGLIAVAFSCLIVGGRPAFGGRWNGAVWTVLLAETAAMVPLCLGSDGAWINYAIPSATWASVLLGCAAARSLEDPRLRVWLLPMAGLVVLAANGRLVVISHEARVSFRAALQEVFKDSDVMEAGAASTYFPGLPQLTRLRGRVSLAHDEWLYQSFDAMGMAEPRDDWMRRVLTGPEGVRVVVERIVPNRPPSDYSSLGYRLLRQYGEFAVWVRSKDPGPR